ncbi:membrane protein insertase YidC [Candidatus Dependentiae bacterium]|jgi:YidC/Oxa1 family membrane protein insertase|nr:membrane protein insertase YidC [Candidatus Dependentiae bacterium]
MNERIASFLKNLVFALALTWVTMQLFGYFFGSKTDIKQGEIRPGQQAQALMAEELFKPLNLDVSFAEQKVPAEEDTEIGTDYCNMLFSSHGAVLQSIDFKEHLNKNGKPLRTIFDRGSMDEEQRKKGCFLLAFEDKTPYFYKLIATNRGVEKTDLIYQAHHEGWTITKTFGIYKKSYQLDVTLAFESDKKHSDIKPRLFFGAPYIAELGDDAISLITYNETKNSIERRDVSSDQGAAWYWKTNKPIFGAEDKYFLHSMINDPSKFAQRAYFKMYDSSMITPILEGPTVTEKQSYTLSFYIGPKVFDHLIAVDERLEEVMSFGWLSWFCKLLLKLLQWLYDLIGNYGLAIIVMSFVLKLPFAPFSIYARKKTEEYQKFQPSITRIREKYKHDQALQHQEFLKFHRDHNISPTTPAMGCLPLVVQIPILFSLYRVLGNYLDLYQAPFFGWLTDLSAKDPFYVLPILLGLFSVWQQSLMPVSDEKQRIMSMFMAVVMTVVFASFPAGLVLYWLMNTLFTIAEDYARKLIYR